MDDKDTIIKSYAIASTVGISNWKFIPTGNLYIDDHDIDSYVGELDYQNSNYEIGPAIQMKNWVFVLEKMTNECRTKIVSTNDPKTWIVAGYHGQSHYSFFAIKDEAMNDALLRYVMEKIIPILHPELFDYSSTNEIPIKRKPMSWEIVALKNNNIQ